MKALVFGEVFGDIAQTNKRMIGCRYLNYATGTIVKSGKLVPTLLISVTSLDG